MWKGIRKVAMFRKTSVVNTMLENGWCIMSIVEHVAPGGYPVWVLGTSDATAEVPDEETENW